jgi:hypothetical protein
MDALFNFASCIYELIHHHSHQFQFEPEYIHALYTSKNLAKIFSENRKSISRKQTNSQKSIKGSISENSPAPKSPNSKYPENIQALENPKLSDHSENLENDLSQDFQNLKISK